MNNKLLYTLILILIVLNVYQYLNPRGQLKHESSFEPTKSTGFMMSNNLSCTVKESSNSENLGGVQSLLDLNTDNPRFLSNNGGTFNMNVYHQSEETLVLGFVASGSGGTDFFLLNKKSGEFARTTSGNVTGVYAEASKGNCK